MYAKGMTTGDIEAHIQDIYGISVSDSTVSRITDKILPIVREWQQRPLEGIYAVVFLDAIHYHVRSEGQIVKKAVYIAIGIDLDGRKDVLGMWVGENESAKFWATVLNGLKNRGVEDIFIACTDNLTGFDAAIHATFPQTEIQNCILHQLRNSSRYVSYKELKALMADLKAVYNTLDFPTENRVPTGVLLAPIGNPEPKGLCPSGHPAYPCSGYPSCFRTPDTLLLGQVKQVQRFARIAGRFLCLFLFSGGWAKNTRKPCRTRGLGWKFSHWSAKTDCPKPLYLV